jgi:hypothetical protein
MFFDNPNYILSEELLIQIHQLYVDGQEDSPEADNIIDLMDDPWYKMPKIERERFEKISSDLLMISGGENFHHDPFSLFKFVIYYVKRNYEEILSCLRKEGCTILPIWIRASVRGECYRNLGHVKIGKLFDDYARKMR